MLMPLLLMVIVCMGANHSTVFNKIVTAINLAVVVFVVGVGLWHLDTKNWTPRKNFAPNGVSGILAGAASCFYCFVGFDVIATAGEETVNPRRNIPLSIVLSLLISFFCYFGVATVLTMMVSSKDLSEQAPLANAFGDHAFKVYIALIYFPSTGVWWKERHITHILQGRTHVSERKMHI
jgi:cationic amino acid transporter 14